MKKADFATYLDKAKSGKLSALIKSHTFGDVVVITNRRGQQVRC